MLSANVELKPGIPVTSPGGRRLEIGDIFVPRHDTRKSRSLPPSFRYLTRKVVVFKDGSIAPLAEVKQRFYSPPLLSETRTPKTRPSETQRYSY